MSRATFIPARTSFSITSYDDEAGPIVAMIFALLMRDSPGDRQWWSISHCRGEHRLTSYTSG
ncbi:hypothetical protein FHX48_000966 [Microbacterium halimionae]|uniref:Uncharacterized protein n=1 Tax=Microbacterium halimionae TaxID=1526413 RepID=A0A7W3PL79_9MICO|nr:hypothetical protein [Microbacterium halimionae]NII96096.1 hypothetical protein [Microbacterium halimionae]